MGIEKQGLKGGNYVGGFLQLFDWNAKSRKKLFSSKSDLPEKSKQKKRFDGTLPTTSFIMMDGQDEIGVGSSVRGGSEYSYASSVTDDDLYVNKGPGVVARLMGLESLPKSSASDPYSTPLFDCQSLPGSYYKSEHHQDPQIMQEMTFEVESKYQRVIIQRPIEKFQTEMLPPRSAKSIPITHNKLLSPIKRTNFIPSKDAAEIMEAAARIIEAGPQASRKTKLPLAGSSSGPLKVKDLKEKVQSVKKPTKISEGSQRSGESSGVKHVKGGGPVDAKPMRVFQDCEESSSGVKSKGKSISLALQAKANVQKREALNLNGSRTFGSQSETNEFSPSMSFTSQKSTLKKPSMQKSSNVLRQNNQKQNCSVERGKLGPKCNVQGGKAVNGDSSSARRQNSNKLVGNSKVSSRKLSSDVKDDRRHALSSSSERTSKKRSIDGNYHSERNQAVNDVQKDKNGKGDIGDSGKMGTDVISFTFTSPMRATEVRENCKIFSADSPSKRAMLNSDGMAASKFSFLAHNVKGGDTLSTFLEQQLKELAHKVEFSQQKSCSNMLEEHNMKAGSYSINPEGQLGSSLYSLRDSKGSITGRTCQGLVEEGRNMYEERTILNLRLPSPVSVLEHSSFMESSNSSDSAESNHSTVDGSNKCLPLRFLDNISGHSMNTGDTESSDSASSTSARYLAKTQEKTTLTRSWELKYVKLMLSNIDQMFNDYTMGRACEIISPRLFDQLESCKHYFNDCGPVSRTDRRLMFDCVSESLDRRCRKNAEGGCKLWEKGVGLVKRKERLAEDIYKEISGFNAMGDFMVDELVDYDMSSSTEGRWLDYDVEGFQIGLKIDSRILNSLIDEVIADILVL